MLNLGQIVVALYDERKEALNKRGACLPLNLMPRRETRHSKPKENTPHHEHRPIP